MSQLKYQMGQRVRVTQHRITRYVGLEGEIVWIETGNDTAQRYQIKTDTKPYRDPSNEPIHWIITVREDELEPLPKERER